MLPAFFSSRSVELLFGRNVMRRWSTMARWSINFTYGSPDSSFGRILSILSSSLVRANYSDYCLERTDFAGLFHLELARCILNVWRCGGRYCLLIETTFKTACIQRLNAGGLGLSAVRRNVQATSTLVLFKTFF